MKVCGYNPDSRLSGSISNKASKSKLRYPCQSSLNPSQLLSLSSYFVSIWVTQSGEAFAVGDNLSGRISSTLPKEEFGTDTKINIYNLNGQPCKFISVVSGDYTLYQVSGEKSGDPSQLVYSCYQKETIFLNIGKRSPLSLFGGSSTSAVIDTEGSVIIITKSVYDSPTSELKALNLPNGDRAVKVACGKEVVFVLGESGKLFEYSLEATSKLLKEVRELSKIKINEISGTSEHFFAIADDGRVFGRGRNYYNKLGMPGSIREVSEFTVIEPLSKYHVVEAYAGYWDSLFRTSDGKILGCGWNSDGQLMLKDSSKKDVSPPEETVITSGATFCISGGNTSIVFVGVEPPPNTPNRKITKFPKDETAQLLNTLNEKEKEISSLKEELEKTKALNIELEKEVQNLKKQISSKVPETAERKGSRLDIIDTETLDKLKRIKSLGRGATSEVFEVAREERLALKVYYPSIVSESKDDDDDEEEEGKVVINFKNVQRFLLEYESLNQLDHANIIKAFGISFGDATHPPAILLEYCASNLKKKIKKLTNSERICAIVDISSAMKEVHAVGIIHRDLKLENILVDENNKIKVSDFGLCTLMTLDSETMSRTQMTGTLKYMAPELIQERTDYNEKVDVYAFGVVVYLILTKGEFPKISLHDVGNGKKAEIPSGITQFSSDLINKCWSYEASERPSFAEICQTLKGNESKLI
ncbi:hypothetical protein M9Y10_021338 [Tritrichomonas musculus]|uniref:Protein kinase domain-containing protein n=1 Tax=Tritrichomonas musculus TaxID=1915356 RepID=A0ABR2HDS6_9EUKA